MGRYLLRRLLHAVPVLLGVTVIVFLSMALLPGDPAQAILGPYATPENLAQLRADLGLDHSLAERYGIWLGSLLEGDLGRSYSLHRPVSAEVVERLGPTLLLAGVALIIACLAGLGSGVVMAVWQFGWPDRLLSVLILVGVSLPSFWLALMAILLLAVWLPLFPVSGMVAILGGGGPADLLHHLALPALVLAAVASAVLGRLTRTHMLEVLRQDFVRTARAKGAGEIRVVLRHALPNALVNLVPVIALQFGYLIGGAVYVETIFQWPGIGRMLVQAIASRDLLLVQGGVLVIALIYVLLNLLADVVQRLLDPRIGP